MKKFFTVLGIIFATLIIIGAIGLGISARQGRQLDAESKAYVDEVVPKILTDLTPETFYVYASEEFTKAVPRKKLESLCNLFKKLGRFIKYNGSEGDSKTTLMNNQKSVLAEYVASADFEKGPAEVRVALIKHDDKWYVLYFNINSEAFLEK